MAYVSGSAASFADLKTAIENACVANSWTLSSGILSKDGCFFKLDSLSAELKISGGTGQTGSSLTGLSTYQQKLANIANVMVFPINYEIHIFTNPNEVYCIINYNSNFFQQISFGQSDIPSIGGIGAWHTGSYQHTTNTGDNYYLDFSFQSQASYCGTYGSGNLGGLFFTLNGANQTSTVLHCGLDSVGWKSDGRGTPSIGMLGADYAAGILTSLPNVSNGANVLVPIKGMLWRASGGLTVVINLKNARYVRIDNINPGEVITFGSEQWKCYPFYRKDTTVRNVTPVNAQHSGTFGYAIKYTGP